MKDKNIEKAFSGASWLFSTAIFHKGLTFMLTHTLVRMTNPEIFGLAAIQLELLLSSLLFLSRFFFRFSNILKTFL
jgi:oligosaccharide translocation protein RFT1